MGKRFFSVINTLNMDGVIGGIILYKVGGRGLGQWNGLKPPPLPSSHKIEISKLDFHFNPFAPF